MKAQVGDYLRKDGKVVCVVGINHCFDEVAYLTSDGGVISDKEVSIDDVLLPSEVE